MGWEFTPLAVGLLALTGAVFGLGAYLLLRRRGSARRRLAVITGVVMVTAAVWVAAYALGLSATDRGGMLFWVRVQYLTTAALPLLWLAFVDEYVDRELGLTRRRWATLSGVPLIGVALVFTNGQHGLAWSAAEVATVQETATMTFTYGPAYYLHALYGLAVVFVALAFLIGAFVRAEGAYRRQSGMLLASVAFPITGSVLDVSTLNPYAPLDLAVFEFIGAVGGVALTVQRHQLFSLVPVGRETAVNQLPDPLVVLDDGDRILEVNPAARELAAVDRELFGCTLDELPAENPLREVLTAPGVRRSSASRARGDSAISTARSPRCPTGPASTSVGSCSYAMSPTARSASSSSSARTKRWRSSRAW